ncbi:MAG: hypothetical protein M1526_04530 [Candidatus Thermoplasmatota archaeon]|jgi:hypothetical protein|nr:hypothetical protein [Candidatus Thermoplasmatota archaeon]
MFIRKVKEIDENGKTITQAEANRDTSLPDCQPDKAKLDASKQSVEVLEKHVMVLEGGKDYKFQLTKASRTTKDSLNRITTSTVFHYRTNTDAYDAQIYTIIVEHPYEKGTRLYWITGDISPKTQPGIHKYDLILSKKMADLGITFKQISKLIDNAKNEGDLDAVVLPLSTEFNRFSNLISKYTDISLPGNRMAFVGDFNALKCLDGILGLIECITTTDLAEICPYCAVVLGCADACIDVVTLPVCLLCLGISLGACAACALLAYMCVDAAEEVRNNC